MMAEKASSSSGVESYFQESSDKSKLFKNQIFGLQLVPCNVDIEVVDEVIEENKIEALYPMSFSGEPNLNLSGCKFICEEQIYRSSHGLIHCHVDMEVDDEMVQEKNMEYGNSINHGEPSSTNTSLNLPDKDIIIGSFHLVPNVDIEVVYKNEMEHDEVVSFFQELPSSSETDVSRVRKVHKSTRAGGHNMPAKLPPLPSESELFDSDSDTLSRKEKSLSVLTKNFLEMFPYLEMEGSIFSLDETADALNTDTHRMYIIIAVFKAINIIEKVHKNTYMWHGFLYFTKTFAWLRQLSSQLGIDDQYSFAKDQELAVILKEAEDRRHNNMEEENHSHLTSSPIPPPSSSSDLSSGMYPKYKSDYKFCTSVGINTQMLVMLMMVAPEPKTVNMEFAATALYGSGLMDKQKTGRIRRLNDIANILFEIGILRKVKMIDVTSFHGKRNAIQYSGPDVEGLEVTQEEKMAMPSGRKNNSLLVLESHSQDERGEEIMSENNGETKKKRGRKVGSKNRVKSRPSNYLLILESPSQEEKGENNGEIKKKRGRKVVCKKGVNINAVTVDMTSGREWSQFSPGAIGQCEGYNLRVEKNMNEVQEFDPRTSVSMEVISQSLD